jgi:hypothetical protein
MSEIRVAAPLFCPTMHGVIGETVKPGDFEYGQNRGIFGHDLAAGNRGAISAAGLVEKWASQAARLYGNRPSLIPHLPMWQGSRARRQVPEPRQAGSSQQNAAIAHFENHAPNHNKDCGPVNESRIFLGTNGRFEI